jgi:hypothetical protein
MSNILLTGGAGDVWALESMMSDEERDAIQTIHWATRAEPFTRPVFESSRRYGHVKHVVYPTNKDTTYFEAAGVRKAFPQLPEDVEDWSISVRFREFFNRTHTLSTFLKETPVRVPYVLPRKYVLIQHQTPVNSDQCRSLRDLDAQEWGLVLARLEREKLYGVVVDSRDADPPPDHPRVINLVGLTTYAESIAVLRRASGFWGIASSLCVLASQLFKPEQFWVKGPESWLLLNRHIYFAPYLNPPFVHRHLSEKPINWINNGMTTIQMLVMRLVRGNLVGAGCLVELPTKEAEGFIRTGQAVLFDPAKGEHGIYRHRKDATDGTAPVLHRHD